MDYTLQISEVKEEIRDLKNQLNEAIRNGKEEKELVIRQQITAMENQLTELYRENAPPEKKFRRDDIFYMVSAQINNSKHSKGYATVFKCAQDCKAYYSLEGKAKSIFYNEGSNDLKIRLLFASVDSARDFLNTLSNFGFQHPSFCDKIEFEERLTEFSIADDKRPDWVFYKHYQAEDSDSPPFLSLNEMLWSDSNSVRLEVSNPEVALQSLEDLTKFPLLKFYKCHIISATVKEYSKNPDNIIFGYGMFRQYFDVLYSENPYPELAVKFDSIGGDEEVQLGDSYERRWRVNVVIEFFHEKIAEAYSLFLKSETQKIENETLRYKSFLYARNPDEMKYFLDYKYNETVAMRNS